MWILLKNYYTVNRGTFSWSIMPFLIMTSVVYLIERSIVFMVFAFSMVYISSLMNTEEKNHTDILYRSLPVRPSSIVYSRYIAASAIFAGVFLPAFLVCSFIETLDIPGRTGLSPVITVTGFFVIAVPAAVLVAGIFPFCFKYGYVKGMLVGSAASVLAAGIFAVILYLIVSISGKTEILGAVMAKADRAWIVRFIMGVFAQAAVFIGKTLFPVFISIVTALLVVVSVRVSVRFYKNRDF